MEHAAHLVLELALVGFTGIGNMVGLVAHCRGDCLKVCPEAAGGCLLGRKVEPTNGRQQA